MPNKGNVQLLFIFDDEVRIAACALAALRAINRDDPTQQDLLGDAMVTALNACMAALHGAEDANSLLVLTTKAALGVTPNVVLSGARDGLDGA